MNTRVQRQAAPYNANFQSSDQPIVKPINANQRMSREGVFLPKSTSFQWCISRNDRWLQSAEAQTPPLDLLPPFPSEKMLAWKANSRVGNVQNDEQSLLVCDDAPTLWGGRKIERGVCRQANPAPIG